MPTYHQRKIIRDAVAAALVAGSTAAGSRVFKTRVDPFRSVELPALAVYATTEQVDSASKETAPRILDRSVNVEIVAAVEPGDSVDDAVDAIAKDIERVMDADPTFGNVCRDSLLSSTEIDVMAKGDRNIGMLGLTYSVRYFTDAPDADDQTLDNLNTVDTNVSLGGAQATADQAGNVADNLQE